MEDLTPGTRDQVRPTPFVPVLHYLAARPLRAKLKHNEFVWQTTVEGWLPDFYWVDPETPWGVRSISLEFKTIIHTDQVRFLFNLQ